MRFRPAIHWLLPFLVTFAVVAGRPAPAQAGLICVPRLLQCFATMGQGDFVKGARQCLGAIGDCAKDPVAQIPRPPVYPPPPPPFVVPGVCPATPVGGLPLPCVGPGGCNGMMQIIDDTISSQLVLPTQDQFAVIEKQILKYAAELQENRTKAGQQSTALESKKAELEKQNTDSKGRNKRNVSAIKAQYRSAKNHQPSLETGRKMTGLRYLDGMEQISRGIAAAIHEELFQLYTLSAGRVDPESPMRVKTIEAINQFMPREFVQVMAGGQQVFTGTANTDVAFMNQSYPALRNEMELDTPLKQKAGALFLVSLAGDIPREPGGDEWRNDPGRAPAWKTAYDSSQQARSLGVFAYSYRMLAERFVPERSNLAVQASRWVKDMMRLAGEPDSVINAVPDAVSAYRVEKTLYNYYSGNHNFLARLAGMGPKQLEEELLTLNILYLRREEKNRQDQQLLAVIQGAILNLFNEMRMRSNPDLRRVAAGILPGGGSSGPVFARGGNPQ
ncbi:MAG: hypothetical protein M3O22_03205 [Pseudomonadota bacterium]|nr:hypothetical protein [Pseudomonadota bacterium]